jgi:hypothetical protein
MDAQKATEKQPQRQQQQGSGSQTTLNDRYGKIGISAVAGAVQHKPERKPAADCRFTVLDSD